MGFFDEIQLTAKEKRRNTSNASIHPVLNSDRELINMSPYLVVSGVQGGERWTGAVNFVSFLCTPVRLHGVTKQQVLMYIEPRGSGVQDTCTTMLKLKP